MKRKIVPSLQLICSRDRKYQKNKLVIIEKMIKFWKISIFKLIGTPVRVGKKKVIPKIMVVFRKLAPIMLPTARLACPLNTDFKPIVNSGRLVPNAIMVAPITCCEIPASVAMEIAELTRKFALITTPNAPATV